MKYDYFAEDTDKIEKRRRKSEKRASLRKFFKVLLITLGVIVIVLAAVWALLRYVFVDFYFQSIIPDKQVASYIDENIIGKTTTETTTDETQTQTTLPVYESMTYLDSAHFDFQNDKKGNFVGNILNGGFDQVFNMYNSVVYESGDIIDTLVYRTGFDSGNFGLSTATGLFKSVVSCILVISSYKIAYKTSGYRVF